MPQLSKAQQRYLKQIREAGWKVFNGRASRTLEILEDQGLIRTEWFYHKGDQGKIIKEVWCAVDARTSLDPVQLLKQHHGYLFIR